MEAKPITLITDFGYKDPFVGIMKGVILSINPHALVIDLSHGIPPQDLMGGALVLRYSVPFFPKGTVHVAVVDPGVGTLRRRLLIQSEDSFFIGPDNGILSLALQGKEVRQIIDLSNEIYHLKPTSATFHARDVFAPVAAYLSLGIPPKDFGPKVDDFSRLPWPEVIKTAGTIQGEIIYIDGFGNLITNVHQRDLKTLQPENLTVSFRNLTVQGLSSTYMGGEAKDYVALINSWGFLEISSFKGSAYLRAGAKVGDRIYIRGRQQSEGQTP